MFVSAVTQVTTLLGRQLTLAGFAQAMLVLSLMWWAWSAFVWVANAFPVDAIVLRAALLWVVAAGIDYAGPAWITRKRLRGLQHVAVAHFAERYSLFVIICLGESVVAIGVGARGERLGTSLVAGVTLGLLTTIGMWWSYFNRTAQDAEQGLRDHEDPVSAAGDAYSYIHLAIVAGIIVFAVGAGALVHGVEKPLAVGARLALCGGVSLYLLGLAAFRLRLMRDLGVARLMAAVGAMVIFVLGGALPGWGLAACVAALLGALCAFESVAFPPMTKPSPSIR